MDWLKKEEILITKVNEKRCKILKISIEDMNVTKIPIWSKYQKYKYENWWRQSYIGWTWKLGFIFIFTIVHTIQGSRSTQGSGLLNEMCGMNVRRGSMRCLLWDSDWL